MVILGHQQYGAYDRWTRKGVIGELMNEE